MLIRVERFADDGTTTMGLLFVDGEFLCFTVEDTYREQKVAEKTRIPAGCYDVLLRNAGGMTQDYASRYPDMHKGMLHLQSVPGFEWVYFHTGNTAEHTEGCLLVADTLDISRGFGGASRNAYRKFYPLVMEAAQHGDLRVEIVDRDRGEAA